MSNEVEDDSICKLNYCKVPKYQNHDVCILHLNNFEKNEDDFNKAINLYIQNKGWDFIGIYFPGRFYTHELPDEHIRFSGCQFNGEFRIPPKGIIKKRFIVDSCIFNYSVFLNQCTFNEFTLFRGNKYLASCSFIDSVFNEKTVFYYNVFKFGIDIHKITFNKDKGLFFRNNDMGTSLLYEADIQNINFILCKWNKEFTLAEEVYDLAVDTKFGGIGLPKTYFNQFISHLTKGKKYGDFLIRTLYRNEYDSQKELRKKNSAIYITHTGWNDSGMAEDTYRKLRLRYSQQGEPEIAGEFFYREKVNQRRQKTTLKRIVDYFIKELLFGYGEKPFNVLTSSIIIILIFSGIYKYSNLLKFKDNSAVFDFISALYFSIVTFTTLGYGDYHPTSWLRIFSAIEALFGAVLIALFVVTLTRKLIR